MNPFTSRRRATPQMFDDHNAGIQRARQAHYDQTTCHRCATPLDYIPGVAKRICGDCKKDMP